ncbi:MAG: ABC transporter permease subunit, partial [Actinomycetota bacterium]
MTIAPEDDIATLPEPGIAIGPDDAPRPAAGRGLGQKLAANILPPIGLGALIICGWYFVSYSMLEERRRFLLEPPHKVLQVGFLDWDNFSEILAGLWSSTKVAIVGLILAIMIGFVLAIVMSQAKLLERAIFPYMVTLQAIPILALVPLISFWWGTGEPIWDVPIINVINSRVIVCVIIALFPIIVNTLFGLQSAERGMHDLFTL